MRLRGTAVALGCALMIGCNGPTSPLRALSSTVTLSSSTVQAGSTVEISTVVRNESWQTVTIGVSRCGSRAFRVTTIGGAEVPLNTHVGPCIAMAQMVTLQPGETYTFIDLWDGRDASGAQLLGLFKVVGDPYPHYAPHSQPANLRWTSE